MIWNVYDFFTTYAEVEGLSPEDLRGFEDTVSKHLRGADSDFHNGHGRESDTEISGRVRLTRCKNDDRASRTSQTSISSCDTPLSAAMFMLYGDEVVYLFSGSDEQYMKEYNAQYAIQWYMIKYAAEHGYKKYNF